MATHSPHRKFRMGAVLIKRNKVLSVGFNNPLKTHPKSNNKWKTIHAELDVLLGVPKDDLKGASVYVVRINKKGLMRSSKPCVDCQVLLEHAKIKEVFFLNDDHQPVSQEVA